MENKPVSRKENEKAKASRHPATQESPQGKTMAPPPFQLKSSGKPSDKETESGGTAQLQDAGGGFAGAGASGGSKGGNNTGLPDNLKSGVENLSGYSMDDVKVHYNSQKPSQLQAHAYAQGSDIHVAPGQEKHLAHEAWHVVQQKQGRVKPTTSVGNVGVNDNSGLENEADVMGAKSLQNSGRTKTVQQKSVSGGAAQLRRIPEASEGGELDNTVTDLTVRPPLVDPTVRGDAVNYDAHGEGMQRMIALAESEMTPAQIQQVDQLQLSDGGTTIGIMEFTALPEREQLLRRIRAIQSVAPSLILGDPALIDVGARTGTTDTANIQTLVDRSNAIFDAIAAGTHDADLQQIFGSANVAAAKTKYANAKTWMNTLHSTNKIVSDRSGYNNEVGLGGLTGTHRQISLAPGTIDNPADNESIVTMIHESMHAGNGDVRDYGYIGTASFTALPEATKLNNAAHFEVVPRRILGASHDYAGQTFTPAGTTTDGITAPALTDTELAVRQASETVRNAWTIALNLHNQFVTVHQNPTSWTAVPNPLGMSIPYENCLPYWSKAYNMTIHDKTTIDPTSSDPSVWPVSLIDIALSEGVTRKLAITMGQMPNNGNVDAFETANSATADSLRPVWSAAADPIQQHIDRLIAMTLQLNTGTITGPTERDFRMLKALSDAAAGGTFGSILVDRGPDAFPD